MPWLTRVRRRTSPKICSQKAREDGVLLSKAVRLETQEELVLQFN